MAEGRWEFMKMEETLLEDRPYEKFEKYGLQALTDQDLLAILLRTGTKAYPVQYLAAYLLNNQPAVGKEDHQASLLNLYGRSYEELQAIKGIGKVKALQIISVLELSKRLAKANGLKRQIFNKPEPVANYFMEELRHEQKECFIVTFLDAKCKMMGYERISQGSLTASIVHPREVYKSAIQKSAHSIIVLHNHPSGDPTPSKEDLTLTKRLKEAGQLIGIPLLDHLIIGDGIYCSLKEESYF